MRIINQLAGIGGLTLCITTQAFAAPTTMLGDTITVLRAFPSPTTPYGVWNPSSVATTVTADASDRIDWQVQSFQTLIDPNENSIELLFPLVSRFDTTATDFDGFVFTGFSHALASASILSNTSGLVALLSIEGQQLRLSLNGPNAGGSTGLVLGVNFANVIPTPSSLALSLASVLALGGLGFAKRRTNDASQEAPSK